MTLITSQIDGIFHKSSGDERKMRSKGKVKYLGKSK